MPSDARDILEVLRFELNFLEQGGYGQPARTPFQPRSIFQDSFTCLNFGGEVRPRACAACLLLNFVPESSRNEIVPCHFIPLNSAGDSVATLDRGYNHVVVEQAVIEWLRAKISELEYERVAEVQTA